MNPLLQTTEILDVPSVMPAAAPPREWIKSYSPLELRGWKMPEGYVIAGDCHLVRGNITVIAGAPGIGKSRAAGALAVAGATGKEWFGLPLYAKFKTYILQGENPMTRLKAEYGGENADTLDRSIRISDTPPYGMAFQEAGFRGAFQQELAGFSPDVLILDPWNGIARDDGQRDYREALDTIRDAIPKDMLPPAIVIVAHTRKPKGDDRRTGRSLLHEIAGSHLLASVPRCAFVMQAASDEPEDDRIVWSCAKNNDGELGSRTAWHRRNGLFTLCPDFDWKAFDATSTASREQITESDLATLFHNGTRLLKKSHAVKELEEQTKYGQAACYNALKSNGRFGSHLREDKDGLLSWVP